MVRFFFQDGTTPLILTAAGGHLDAVTELLHQGADPNAKRLVSSEPRDEVNENMASESCEILNTCANSSANSVRPLVQQLQHSKIHKSFNQPKSYERVGPF